jgi:Ca2+-binding EF-hand superfamily protein
MYQMRLFRKDAPFKAAEAFHRAKHRKSVGRSVSLPDIVSSQGAEGSGSAPGSEPEASTQTPPKGTVAEVPKTVVPNDLIWVARHTKVTLDVCQLAAALFSAQTGSIDRSMTKDQFSKCLLKVTGVQSMDKLPKEVVRHAFAIADADKNGTIEFTEFVAWYSSVGFSANVALTPEEREFRDFCKSHGMSLIDMDRYKKYFDEFDADGSGAIEYEEFENLVKKCARVPKGVEVPPSRLKNLWKEADADGGGSIDFQEYALFYRKNFESGSSGGFESFYKNVRPPLGEGTLSRRS